MKTLKRILTLGIVTYTMSSMFISCSKERIEDPSLKQYKSLNEYFDSKKQKEQEFIIDSGGIPPIVGEQGTRIWPSKSAIMFANGDSVKWPYTVKLIELYTPKDMIYYQQATAAAGVLLNDDGQIKLRAFKDNEQLQFKAGASWKVEMPNKKPQSDMKLRYGNNEGTLINWNLNSDGDFANTDTSYIGQIGQFGWSTCAKLNATSPKYAKISFTSSTDDLLNVGIFIYLPTQKTLVQVFDQNSIDLPVGETARIILIGIDSGNKLYAYYKEMSIDTTNTIDVTLTEISETDLTKKLDNLNL